MHPLQTYTWWQGYGNDRVSLELRLHEWYQAVSSESLFEGDWLLSEPAIAAMQGPHSWSDSVIRSASVI